ncbi:protein WHAT'S THIS FACTOR 1 homolog [Papaver somniferum]|uniref:protein WHAT'S THIS FACTOR 1 homolog n=1 Tax=Papaver somniferum TaxID=3469 RepID=UPI000E6F9C5B|nr:protein WHAT'S THIS FACTOR 1 homolog [Papaver somniferum]
MASLSFPPKPHLHPFLQSSSSSLSQLPPSLKPFIPKPQKAPKKTLSISISCTAPTTTKSKIIKNPSLDKQVTKQNKIRFVQKLKTLILSKPQHYIQLQILSKCRSYLAVPKPRSLLSMIHRYPTIFQTFTIPSSSTHQDLVCIRLTPKAKALALQELSLKSEISTSLAIKLQKLLMLSSHHRLLLSKLVHLGPDLGLPPNFRSRLCNSYPDRFKTVDTSYGRALELVSWDPELAIPMPLRNQNSPELIVERPLKFKHLKLRKGLNLKRKHRDFLIKFGELPEVSPYNEVVGEIGNGLKPHWIEAEKRSCALVREVLGMTVEKRTLVDHLTHFRKEFGLSNKMRGMLIRHPELFYVSIKGQRDSVFLVESYDDEGKIIEKDELLGFRDKLIELVREGKKMRRERRKKACGVDYLEDDDDVENGEDVAEEEEFDDDNEDGFEDLFVEDEWEDYGVEENDVLGFDSGVEGKFWTSEAASAKGESRIEMW